MLRLHDSCGCVHSEALRSLQRAGWIYDFVSPCTEVQFPENYNGLLHVRVCWHEVVYRAEVNFGPGALAF
jgi:hypothetical protein